MQWLRGLAIASGIVFAIMATLWSVSRLRGASEEQRAALALLDRQRPAAGSNGFPALWLLRYDVPAAQQAAVTAGDMRRIAQADASTLLDFRSEAAGRFADLAPPSANWRRFCGPSEDGCLRRVAADPAGYTELTARYARLLDRIDALSNYDEVRSELPLRLDVPLPPVQWAGASLTRRAHEFLHGDQDAALAATCRGLTTWRRFGAGADNLIMRMMAVSYADGHVRLLADMLPSLPRERPLPQACSAATAPASPEELSLCEAIRGEFRYLSAGMIAMYAQDAQRSASQRWRTRLLFDAEMSRAACASALAPACGEHEPRRVADDRALAPRREASLLRLDCVGNLIGCVLVDTAVPSYDDSLHRVQDFGGRLRMLGTLLWLRDQPDDGRTLSARLADRPAALKSPTREITIGEDGRSLRMSRFASALDAEMQLPLPDYLVAAPTGD